MIRIGTDSIVDAIYIDKKKVLKMYVGTDLVYSGASIGLIYELNASGKSYRVTGIGTCKDTDIIIPATYKNLPVTAIGDGAFYYYLSLTSIEIPDSVTMIGKEAFKGCESLISIKIPDSVTSIGDSAFSFCDSLTSVVIGDGVTTIGDYAFYRCSGLTSVFIPDSVTTIGEGAFYYCESLTSVLIPDSVTSIGSDAFAGCSSLTRVVIPDSVTSIGDSAFQYCDSLTSVIIGDSVTTIGSSAFSGCDSLKNIVIPASVNEIGYAAFVGCDSLEEITLPFVGEKKNSIKEANTHFGYIFGANTYSDNSTYVPTSLTKVIVMGGGGIRHNAFQGCDNLTRIEIPDGVTAIGDEAFIYCSGLESVVIGNSVTMIGEGAFSYCSNLKEITLPFVGGYSNDNEYPFGYIFGKESYEGSIGVEQKFYVSGNLWERTYYIPEKLKQVKVSTSKAHNVGVGTIMSWGAFMNCKMLKKIIIGKNMGFFSPQVFYGCSNLEIITFEGTVAEWDEIIKSDYWNEGMPANVIVDCIGQ